VTALKSELDQLAALQPLRIEGRVVAVRG